MKVAVVSCNIGGIDPVREFPEQSVPCEYYYFTEKNLPFPLVHFDNRMKGKYLKTQMHRYIDADVFIWIDGSVEVISRDFVKECLYRHRCGEVAISRHRDRDNIHDEFEFIFNHIKAGNKYLIERYGSQPMAAELEYINDMVSVKEDLPLFNCFFFVQSNTRIVNEAFNEWWDKILRYSCFDQALFTTEVFTRTSVNLIDNDTVDAIIKRHKHIK